MSAAVDISHLHLHVRDRRRSVDFYRRWFDLAVWREDDEITFLRGSGGFLLALMDDVAPAPPPSWFHFGIRLPCAAAVRDMCDRMQQQSVAIMKPLYEDPTFASFRCRDPEGYAVEVYWEP